MDGMESLLFLGNGFLMGKFLYDWYIAFLRIWLPERVRGMQRVFLSLPLVAFVILLFTLRVLASFDVVGDAVYISFYLFMGFGWLSFGLFAMRYAFDLSWRDDVVSLNNRAAAPAVVGGFLAITLIYAGANIGDGPGWWCVLFAGGLGLCAWLLLGILLNACTGIFERITVDRERGCGLRFGAYLLASGLLLARASSGDWTSASQTILEFADGWPVLPLTLLALAVELSFRNKRRQDGAMEADGLLSALIGALYIALALLALFLLPPFPKNELYGALFLR